MQLCSGADERSASASRDEEQKHWLVFRSVPGGSSATRSSSPVVNSCKCVVVADADAEIQIHAWAVLNLREARRAVRAREGRYVRGHAADIVKTLGLVLAIGRVDFWRVDGAGLVLCMRECEEGEEEGG